MRRAVRPVVRFGGSADLGPRASTLAESSGLASPPRAERQLPPQGRKSWSDLGLSEKVIQALTELNIKEPTLIQETAIPRLLQRIPSALIADQTGTGKTLAYLLPIIELLKRDEIRDGVSTLLRRPRALILAPSRELVEQIGSAARFVGRICKLRVLVLVGGSKLKPENEALARQPVDLVVCTPGRLFKHRDKGTA